MLLSHRVSQCRALGAAHAVHAVAHPDYRVHVYEHVRCDADDALLARAFEKLGAVERPMVTVVLAGRARLSIGGRSIWLEAGEVTVLRRKGSALMRNEVSEHDERYQHVNMEWTPGTFGASVEPELSVTRLTASDLARIVEIASSLSTPSIDESTASESVVRLIDLMRAHGMPLERAGHADVVAPVPPAARRLSAALDRLLSEIGTQPMSVDLETLTELSSRQLNRVVRSFNARFGFGADGWRDARNRRRLMMGVAWMTAPNATTEIVARAVGYRSAATFCRAMADAGLPAPGDVRRVMRTLG